MAKGSSIQALYELCKKTFTPSAASASPQAIRNLSALMDTITPAEVGLEDVMEDDRGHGFFGSSFFKNSSRTARWAQPITYLDIYECENFTTMQYVLCTSLDNSPQTKPIIARIDRKAGHGAGRPTKKLIDSAADSYGFMAKMLGISWAE